MNNYTEKQLDAFHAMGYKAPGLKEAICFMEPQTASEVTASVLPVDPTPTKIYVRGEAEEWIVRNADRIRKAAIDRERSAEAPYLEPLVYFIDDPAEMKVIKAHEELTRYYQDQCGLRVPPVLCTRPVSIEPDPNSFASALTNVALVPADENCCVSTDISDVELKDRFLKRCLVKHNEWDAYYYTGQIYHHLSDNELEMLINTVLKKEIYEIGTPSVVKRVEHALLIENTNLIDVAEEPRDRLPLRNGILNLETMQMEPFSPEWPFTWQLRAVYDPVHHNSCPEFDKFIWEVVGGDQIMYQRFWEGIAYTLFAKGQPGKCFLVFWGVGNSGKSVLGEVLSAFYDPCCVSSLSVNSMGEKFATAALVGKKLNLCAESSNIKLTPKAVGFLKAVTGRDKLEIARKYKTSITTRIDATLIFGTNHKIRFEERDDAGAARIRVFPFQYPVPPERQDPTLSERLKSELSGILYKATFYFQQLAERNYKFVGEERVQDILMQSHDEDVEDTLTDALRDNLDAFLETHYREDPDSFVPSYQILESFLEYIQAPDDVSEGFETLFYREIGKRFRRNSYILNKKKRINGKGTSGYEGIRFVP